MTTMEKVIYRGAVYADAGNVVKPTGRSLVDHISTSSTLVKNVGDVKARKQNFLDFLEENGIESDADAYVAARAAYQAFCNAFFLDSSKYIIDEQALIAGARKIVKEPAPEGNPQAVRNSKVIDNISNACDLLDMVLDELRDLNKTQGEILKEVRLNGKTIADNAEESRAQLQRIGPKLGEIDKKYREMQVEIGKVTKNWLGHVNNVASIKAAIDRWLSARH